MVKEPQHHHSILFANILWLLYVLLVFYHSPSRSECFFISNWIISRHCWIAQTSYNHLKQNAHLQTQPLPLCAMHRFFHLSKILCDSICFSGTYVHMNKHNLMGEFIFYFWWWRWWWWRNKYSRRNHQCRLQSKRNKENERWNKHFCFTLWLTAN